VVPINSSLLTITLHSSGYNNTRLKRHKILSPFHHVITEFDCN
jgi:hypothetical protein